jgi:hypothetical protein
MPIVDCLREKIYATFLVCLTCMVVMYKHVFTPKNNNYVLLQK